MNLAELLTVDQIVPDMRSGDHRSAISELVGHLKDSEFPGSTSREAVLELLYQREEQVSTGIGSGVAIPHTFLPDLQRVQTIFGRSPNGIEFGALDNAPVHFVVLFVVPKSEYHTHLRTLAAIAKMFTSSTIRTELSQAPSREEILKVLSKRPNRG